MLELEPTTKTTIKSISSSNFNFRGTFYYIKFI